MGCAARIAGGSYAGRSGRLLSRLDTHPSTSFINRSSLAGLHPLGMRCSIRWVLRSRKGFYGSGTFCKCAIHARTQFRARNRTPNTLNKKGPYRLSGNGPFFGSAFAVLATHRLFLPFFLPRRLRVPRPFPSLFFS